MIYIWEVGDYVPNKWITVHDKTGIDRFLFRRCNYVESTEAFRIESEKEIAFWDRRPYIPSSAGHPIVTMEMAERLAPILGDSAQLYPVEMRCPDGIREARLINPLHCVDAVDWSGTEADYHDIGTGPYLIGFKRLRFRLDALGELPIARLDIYRGYVLVGDSIKELFKSTKMCRFQRDDEVHD